MRMTPEQVAAFEKRTEEWRNKGKVTTHRMGGVDIDKIHKNPKYGNRKTEVDGITFDSKAEAERYKELDLLSKAREIEALELQVRHELRVNGRHICTYISDFTYRKKGKLIVEDVKGVRTRDYIIKKKLMLALHGIEVVET